MKVAVVTPASFQVRPSVLVSTTPDGEPALLTREARVCAPPGLPQTTDTRYGSVGRVNELAKPTVTRRSPPVPTPLPSPAATVWMARAGSAGPDAGTGTKATRGLGNGVGAAAGWAPTGANGPARARSATDTATSPMAGVRGGRRGDGGAIDITAS